MKNKTNKKKTYSFTSWKIGDFVLQLLVVITGIVVTLVASGIITEREQQKQVAKALQLVKVELEDNIKSVENINKVLRKEQDAAKYIVNFKTDFKAANKDSLLYYSSYPFMSHIYNYSSDAYEMLKTSGVMQNIENKELILQIVKSYSALGSLKEFYNWYSEAKEKFGDRINQNQTFTPTYEMYYNRENIDKLWSIFISINDINNLFEFVANGTNFKGVVSNVNDELNNTIKLIEQ